MAGASHSIEQDAGSDTALSTVRLSEFGLRREPPRPPDARQSSYERLFDFDTLFYDVFRFPSDERIACIGPPLLNCKDEVRNMTFRLPGARKALQALYHAPILRRQPSSRFELSGAEIADAHAIVLEHGNVRREIPIRNSACRRFADRRVAITMSKDNPPRWIADWMEFNISVHGANAFIIYDNDSTGYGPEELSRELAGYTGRADLMIVPWPFPYGPGTGPMNIQDSFYCQPGSLEHARRRYLAHARSVLHTDIDELVYAPGGRSIFEEVERSDYMAIAFPGHWIEKSGDFSIGELRHCDCVHRLRWQGRFWNPGRRWKPLRTKWAAVPSRCTEKVEWTVHDIVRLDPPSRLDLSGPNTNVQDIAGYLRARDTGGRAPLRLLSHEFFYWHFWHMSLGPNALRRRAARYSPWRHRYDRELATLLSAVFPEAFERARPHTRWRHLFAARRTA